ncbi:MAG: IMPACT family protein, partial [Anaerococcus sp.]
MTITNEAYMTIKGQINSEFEEEKSIFITTSKYVESEDEALEFIEQINDKYKDATHNCYAYIINQIPEVKRYSDDGEPQGSAGLPMLSVLEKENLKNIAVVVTRYYGGKKLGKGGLIRAYTRGVSECIKDKILYKRPFFEVKLTHAYTVLGSIE